MINLVNVRKSFGELEVLKDINLQIYEKEIYGIIGQSGAGKSTLLRCINGLETYDSGTITVDGTAVDENDKKQLRQLRKDMGMIFQNFNLLSRLDVYDNVALPLRFWNENPNTEENKKKIEHLIELVGLKDKMHERPENLSGGQKQRVAIARALVNDPKILLCDEATSALDPNTTQQILDLLKRINNELGVTIIVITHEMRVIDSICDRVAVIDKSHIAEEGPVAEVFLNPQSEIARELILPQSPLARKSIGTRRIRIIFDGESSDKPVISDMILECQAGVNIVFADTKDIDGKAYGQIIIQLPEDKIAADKITTWLDNNNMKYSKEDDE